MFTSLFKGKFACAPLTLTLSHRPVTSKNSLLTSTQCIALSSDAYHVTMPDVYVFSFSMQICDFIAKN